MTLEILITPPIWLQLSPEIRNFIVSEFHLTRSTSPRCVTERSITRIESDGYTVDDLRKLSPLTMQEWLGFSEIKPDANVHALLCMVADRAELALRSMVERYPKETMIDVTKDDLAPKPAPSIAGAVVEPIKPPGSVSVTGPDATVSPDYAIGNSGPVGAPGVAPSFPKLGKSRIPKLVNA